MGVKTINPIESLKVGESIKLQVGNSVHIDQMVYATKKRALEKYGMLLKRVNIKGSVYLECIKRDLQNTTLTFERDGYITEWKFSHNLHGTLNQLFDEFEKLNKNMDSNKFITFAKKNNKKSLIFLK